MDTPRPFCLNDEDLFSYLIAAPGRRSRSEIEAHLASCAYCREELAGTLKVLHPEDTAAAAAETPLAAREVEHLVGFVRREGLKDAARRRRHSARFWFAAAASLVAAVALGSAGALHFYTVWRAASYFSGARPLLAEACPPESPGGLRLETPFGQPPTRRAAAASEALDEAEKFLYQALAVRSGMRDALLGLGYVELRRGRYARAGEHFDALLRAGKDDAQALLGRGASRFEEGLHAADPIERERGFEGALEDFGALLRIHPESPEARFNRARTFYETGRHQEAREEIESFLRRDPDSIWALKLKEILERMRLSRSDTIHEEMRRAARAHDRRALEAIARAAAHEVPGIVRGAILDSLQAEGSPAAPGAPDAAALAWAARTLTSVYESSTGSRGCSRLLNFYDGLSPPARRIKKQLDPILQAHIDAYLQGKPADPAGSARLLAEYNALGDHWQLVRLHQQRGNAALYRGPDFRVAESEYRNMLRRAELADDPDLVARSLSALSVAFVSRESYASAIETYSRLRSFAETRALEPWSASASIGLGVCYLKLNRTKESVQELTRACAVASRGMDAQSMVVSAEYLGSALEALGRYEDARRLLARAAGWQESFKSDGLLTASNELEAYRRKLLTKQGYLALASGNRAAAEGYFESAMDHRDPAMLGLESSNRLGLAEIRLDAGDTARAQEEVRRVLEISGRIGLPEMRWRADALQAAILERNGDIGRAIPHLEKAIAVLEEMRESATPELRRSFFNRRFDPFRELVSMRVRSGLSARGTLAVMDRAKSATLRELLDRRLKAQAGTTAPTRTGQQPTLPGEIATLEYFVTKRSTFLFLSLDGAIHTAEATIDARELETQVRAYLDNLRAGSRAESEARGRSLHRHLIEPVSEFLDPDRLTALAIIPDGCLHLLPFGGLRDKEGRALLERVALSYAPSRSVLGRCCALAGRGRLSPESPALLLEGTSQLSGAAGEIADLARRFPHSLLRSGAFEAAALGETAAQAEVLHFAGHARLDAGEPRLAFSARGGEGWLEPGMVARWNLRRSLLVSLAGCDTGAGPISEGESPWGFVPAFLEAGAPALLVSLLPADDGSTQILSSQFYRLLLAGGVSKAEALRRAQLSLLAASRNDASTLWNAFVLIGDPR